jgi:hypothetical protein
MNNKRIITSILFELHSLVARLVSMTETFLEPHVYSKSNYVGFQAVAAVHLRSLFFCGVAPRQWVMNDARCFEAAWWSHLQRPNCPMNKFPVKYTLPDLLERYPIQISFSFIVSNKQSLYRPGQAVRAPGGWGFQSAHKGGKVGSPTHRPPLPPGDIPGTHFC